ncbi:hypothetical protein AAG906_021558 [Vitis piasezkii]
MSTSSLEQAILKISKVMEDFVGTNAKRSRKVLKIDTLVGDCYDNSMDQPSIENHKVQDDKGLLEPFKASTSPGKRRETNSLGPNGKDANFESIASNGAQFGVEMKKLWPFEDDCAKLNGNVAAAPHFATVQTVCDLDLKRRSYGHLKESNFSSGRVNSAYAKFSHSTIIPPCVMRNSHNTPPCANFSHHPSLVPIFELLHPYPPQSQAFEPCPQLLKVGPTHHFCTTSFLLIFDSNIEDNVHLGWGES